jgi:hypothetical protein
MCKYPRDDAALPASELFPTPDGPRRNTCGGATSPNMTIGVTFYEDSQPYNSAMAAILIGLGVVALVLVIAAAARRRREHVDTTAVMRELRERALTADAMDIGVAADPAVPWGVIMETGYPGAVASLVAFADGSASLYLSSGGGVIGGGEHASVNAAARSLITKAAGQMHQFEPAPDHPVPAEGMTRFYIRTEKGLRTAAAPESELAEGKHPLTPLFEAGHEVITELRLISEQ